MTTCSFCKQSGHNIRTCSDPRIWQLWQSLVVTFLIPKIGSVFTIQDKWTILGFLSSEYPEDTVRATAYRFTQKNHGFASYVQHHYRNELFDYMIMQLEIASALPTDMLTEWIGIFARDSPHVEEVAPLQVEEAAPLQVEDPDTVTWIEDRNPTPIHVDPSYPIITPIMICLETQSELQELIECVICQEDKPLLDSNTTNCGHSFCHGCITQHMAIKGKQRPPCPLCRAPITSLEIKDIEHFCDVENQFGQTACIIKDCANRAFPGSDPLSYMMISHCGLIDSIINQLDDEDLLKLVYSKDTILGQAETLWRYMWTNGIGDHHYHDISYEEFMQGMNASMRNLENMPDRNSIEVY